MRNRNFSYKISAIFAEAGKTMDGYSIFLICSHLVTAAMSSRGRSSVISSALLEALLRPMSAAHRAHLDGTALLPHRPSVYSYRTWLLALAWIFSLDALFPFIRFLNRNFPILLLTFPSSLFSFVIIFSPSLYIYVFLSNLSFTLFIYSSVLPQFCAFKSFLFKNLLSPLLFFFQFNTCYFI